MIYEAAVLQSVLFYFLIYISTPKWAFPGLFVGRGIFRVTVIFTAHIFL